jgi:hypothetical protein
MPVLAVYQQSFQASETATYAWSFQMRRVLKTKQSSRFVVKMNQFTGAAFSLLPAGSNNQLILYMTSPELCSGTDTQIRTPTGVVNTNKYPIAGTASTNVFVCNEYPVNPIIFNYEFTSNQAAPTSGTLAFTVLFTIYEIDGDIPDNVIF